MLGNIASRLTRITALVPLLSSTEGHHDASGLGAGNVWFPSDHLHLQTGSTHTPLVGVSSGWTSSSEKIVTSFNPTGTISNSDLDLSGGLLHLEALAQSLDACEQTILSKTNNLDTLYLE